MIPAPIHAPHAVTMSTAGPGRDEARRLLEGELAKPAYQEAQPSLLDQAFQSVIDWFLGTLSEVRSLDAGLGTVLLAGGIFLVVAITAVLVGRRISPSARAARQVFTGSDISTAADHRRRAAEAAAAQNWNEALTERLRAVIREAEERVILDRQPGRTATEASDQLSAVFPGAAADIGWLTERFNEVVYGGARAGQADCTRAAALDASLLSSSPARSSATPGLAAPR